MFKDGFFGFSCMATFNYGISIFWIEISGGFRTENTGFQ